MYELNTKQGKQQRIEQITKLNKKLATLKPTEHLDIGDILIITQYLHDIREDLKGQLFMDDIRKAKELREQQK